MRDTIFAPATAPGRSAVAVVRISGPKTAAALRSLAGRLPPPRTLSRRRLAWDGQPLDEALAVWFPGPASYTGEDCAELQLHGGAAVVAGVTEALGALGLRFAAPGEFTRRAFEGGRLDLDEAEAVADLVEAETQGQARQALAQLGGALGARYTAWRGALLEALALLEAAVDFADEDLPPDLIERASLGLDALIGEMAAALGQAKRGEAVREGYRVAIVGAPNAGKSSLLNALVGRDAAIVTATPGTTRDVIEAPLTIEGFKVLVADMAGVRTTCEPIEAEGVRRATAWAEAAALRLWVVDGGASDGAWGEAAALTQAGDLLVLNKADLPRGSDAGAAAAAAAAKQVAVLEVAAGRGEITALREALAARVRGELAGADFPAVTRQRHAALLEEALACVRRGAAELATPELAAEDLRLAARAMERIAGRIGAEEVLDRIFASFCIGK
ncbi:MAG: tRNA uridine-5-carboxymethylaminomethyl(34) synthesis GTPase MnmE [Caulobacteraceae bacterium]|nr:tRNA uridine-5-carboxymethylaminomethyl(34) synthesis GTPase MnmE [Caulobacteraceae bacterium]